MNGHNEKINIVYKTVDEVKPYINNPRNNNAAVDQVAESIKEFGFKVPIVIDSDNVIVTGHTRLKAAIKLGLDEVPCIYANDLTPEQIKAFRLADNKVSEASEWNESLLDLELLDLQELGISMEKFGFELDLGVEEQEEKEKKERDLESMELKTFEHYDYIVFVFDNQMDWLFACNEFNLHKVNAGYGKIKKVGVGRVLSGKELLKRIRHKDTDIEQGSEQFDNNA